MRFMTMIKMDESGRLGETPQAVYEAMGAFEQEGRVNGTLVELGGLLPIPGGIGGIDGGLIGTFIVFGAPPAAATAAVLAYRIILFWVPLVLGAVAFVSLRRSMARPAGFIPCAD